MNTCKSGLEQPRRHHICRYDMSCLVISLESGDVYSESGNLISIIGWTRIGSRERDLLSGKTRIIFFVLLQEFHSLI